MRALPPTLHRVLPWLVAVVVLVVATAASWALPGATSVDLRQSPDRAPWTTTLSCADVER
jgi:hypothetical protein